MHLVQQWESFQSGEEPEGVREDLLQSWRRSKWSGVDPENAEIKLVDVPLDTAFMRAAMPPMLQIAESLGESPICLTLGDAKGNVTWKWSSDRRLATLTADGGLIETSHWGEEAVGTNGTGTALESRSVATVVGAGHYAQALHDWTCIAAPVFHPVTRRACGFVNITCRVEDTNELLQLAIRMMVENVRQALELNSSSAERGLLNAYLARRPKTLAPLVAVNDKIVISDDVVIDHRDLWSRVCAADPQATHITLHHSRTARIWPVTPGTLANGAVLILQPSVPEITPAAGRIGLVAPLVPKVEPSRLSPLEQAEMDVIVKVLQQFSGHKSRTAEHLGISRRALYDKLHYYRLR
ncbi:hypothetical protein BH09ACT10_BH09ACT10_30000 [soil metagenome]